MTETQEKMSRRDQILQALAHMLESNPKFMVIEEMSIQRVNETDLEELEAQLTVSGFIQSMETGKNKTI